QSVVPAAAAVLAVVAVLVGVLGGGDSDDVAAPDTTPTARASALSPRERGTASPEDRPSNGSSPRQRADDTPPSAHGPEAVGLEIHELRDKGSTVELSWRSKEPLTYAVFVAEQGGGPARVRYRGSGTSMTVTVHPELKYCF